MRQLSPPTRLPQRNIKATLLSTVSKEVITRNESNLYGNSRNEQTVFRYLRKQINFHFHYCDYKGQKDCVSNIELYHQWCKRIELLRPQCFKKTSILAFYHTDIICMYIQYSNFLFICFSHETLIFQNVTPSLLNIAERFKLWTFAI